MPAKGYTLRDVRRMLGVSRAVVQQLIASGVLSPGAAGRSLRFSFRDIAVLRTAHTLRRAGIPPRRIARALERVRGGLSDMDNLSQIRVSAVGRHVAVRHAGGLLQPETGQYLLDFESEPTRGAIVPLSAPTEGKAPQEHLAYRLFREAERLEREGRTTEAGRAYRQALEIDPTFVDAALNLGCLLCDSARHSDAISVYRNALDNGAQSPLLHYNLGVALEDAGDTHAALLAYHRCVEEAPDFADAHFNAARLHELLGDTVRAIRHFNNYRVLHK
jgi:tetratricopeptide (TPR) repeat protein